jgi:hypothetical protein
MPRLYDANECHLVEFCSRLDTRTKLRTKPVHRVVEIHT